MKRSKAPQQNPQTIFTNGSGILNRTDAGESITLKPDARGFQNFTLNQMGGADRVIIDLGAGMQMRGVTLDGGNGYDVLEIRGLGAQAITTTRIGDNTMQITSADGRLDITVSNYEGFYNNNRWLSNPIVGSLPPQSKTRRI